MKLTNTATQQVRVFTLFRSTILMRLDNIRYGKFEGIFCFGDTVFTDSPTLDDFWPL